MGILAVVITMIPWTSYFEDAHFSVARTTELFLKTSLVRSFLTTQLISCLSVFMGSLTLVEAKGDDLKMNLYILISRCVSLRSMAPENAITPAPAKVCPLFTPKSECNYLEKIARSPNHISSCCGMNTRFFPDCGSGICHLHFLSGVRRPTKESQNLYTSSRAMT